MTEINLLIAEIELVKVDAYRVKVMRPMIEQALNCV